jgi:hypothetical protein
MLNSMLSLVKPPGSIVKSDAAMRIKRNSGENREMGFKKKEEDGAGRRACKGEMAFA